MDIVERFGASIEPYVILSHTWEDEEVTFYGWDKPSIRNEMKGFQKIRQTCELGAADGYRYAWVDTCCIDKTNSTELSEAINSMYKWYEDAAVCYVYLSDLRDGAGDEALKEQRWFKRGWTLQELIAPREVQFFSQNWLRIGEKAGMAKLLSEITSINQDILSMSQDLNDFSVAERMSWASGRETTRQEDLAYCLLGMFGVNMPMLYGEGKKAFLRLQQEIIKTTNDLSIFAWEYVPVVRRTWQDHNNITCGIFAESPSEFAIRDPLVGSKLKITALKRQTEGDVTVTNAGIKITCRLQLVWTRRKGNYSYVLPVARTHGQSTSIRNMFFDDDLGVMLKKVDSDVDRYCPNAYILNGLSMWSPLDRYRELRFYWPPGVRVIRCWPWADWDDETGVFMTGRDGPRGSMLIEVKVEDPIDNIPAQIMEFMFVFFGPLDEDYLTYTLVEYGPYQMSLDIINLRLHGRDMSHQAMFHALRRSPIPRQHSAFALIPRTEYGVRLSVQAVETNPPKWEFLMLVDSFDHISEVDILPWSDTPLHV
ncbi:Vegetative incompatibility protein HET-E-1 [Colletotrichum gloeosporioides]|uniref:Vegetative incompatibility protein HET-E-1 n=1 Tax=Colletotrichum gloeosporioides TaxID=474922 RepID=A0A8H4CRV9_COLGL|nr:Vegetative incompatibility protein HET-E-1 [Colletotrichum gloeosporioides]KAF3808929.1 Vegetative incompatibility protein HET-E-1 [Colletotrichum gloeosporioides]